MPKADSDNFFRKRATTASIRAADIRHKRNGAGNADAYGRFTVRGINRVIGANPQNFKNGLRAAASGEKGMSTRSSIGRALGWSGGGTTSTRGAYPK